MVEPTYLYPMPQKAQFGSNSSLFNPAMSKLQPVGVAKNNSFVKQALERYRSILWGQFRDIQSEGVALQITIEVASNDTTLGQGTNESYSLSLKQDGHGSLRSQTVFGMLRGLETLSQIVHHEADQRRISWLPLQIYDYPRFAYRGLLIDTSRHYLPLQLILDNLDVMAQNKLNVLHWHIVDSPSFPFQSKRYPSLSDKGAWRPDLVYSTEQVAKVVREAYLRGIRVIPEFDTAGHTQSWGRGHPEIMSHCPEPSEPLNPTKTETFELLHNLYEEIAELFADEYVHVGGDEVSFDCWNNDPEIVAWMRERHMEAVDLEQYFETKLLDIVANCLRKKAVVWQEVFDNGLALGPDTVIDVWKGHTPEASARTIRKATAQGFKVLVSGPFYLDHLDEDWHDFHKVDLTAFNGSQAQKNLVIGGHAAMWGEKVDATNFMPRVWPRASAVAEILWSPRGVVAEPRAETLQRLSSFRCQMVKRGVPASPIQPDACSGVPVQGRAVPPDQLKVLNA